MGGGGVQGGGEGETWILFQLSVVTTVGEWKSIGAGGRQPSPRGRNASKRRRCQGYMSISGKGSITWTGSQHLKQEITRPWSPPRAAGAGGWPLFSPGAPQPRTVPSTADEGCRARDHFHRPVRSLALWRSTSKDSSHVTLTALYPYSFHVFRVICHVSVRLAVVIAMDAYPYLAIPTFHILNHALFLYLQHFILFFQLYRDTIAFLKSSCHSRETKTCHGQGYSVIQNSHKLEKCPSSGKWKNTLWHFHKGTTT